MVMGTLMQSIGFSKAAECTSDTLDMRMLYTPIHLISIIRLRSGQNKTQRFPGHPLRAIDFSMLPLHIDFLFGEYEPTPPEDQSNGHGKDFGLGLALDSA